MHFGQIRPQKGLELLADAFARLRQLPDVELVLVGGIPHGYESYGKDLTARFEAAGARVLLNLAPQDISRELHAAHIGVFAFPDGADERRGSLAAALSHGLLCVTTHSKRTPNELCSATVGLDIDADHSLDSDRIANAVQAAITEIRSGAAGSRIEIGLRIAQASSFEGIAAPIAWETGDRRSRCRDLNAMIVGNLYNIKNTNGLFYYGVDYLSEQPRLLRKLLVRPALVEAARRHMPDCEIVSCGMLRMLREAVAAQWRGDILYTPTPHPLPFIGKQWVVVHDSYPFTNHLGRLKRVLLRASLSLSRCRVAYINESETLPFLVEQGLKGSRLIFAPNKIATSDVGFARRAAHIAGQPLRIGLVGTDSTKKNYAHLFNAVTSAKANHELQFLAYGHRTPYFEELVQTHADICIALFESDLHTLPEFLAGIDVLISVADQEGFGRPIAVAATAGIPCLLLAKPVFKEFFSSALFYNDVPSLIAALARSAATGLPSTLPYTPPARVVDAYVDALAQLQLASLRD